MYYFYAYTIILRLSDKLFLLVNKKKPCNISENSPAALGGTQMKRSSKTLFTYYMDDTSQIFHSFPEYIHVQIDYN